MIEQTVPVNAANRFAHIDAMRALAVGLVVIAHAGLGHIVPGGSGVTIFFAISGFIITLLVLKEWDRTEGFSVSSFYFRRLVKIAPPFVLAVVAPTLVYAIWNPVSWRDVLAQVFFVFNWTATDGTKSGVLPGSGVVWSLAIEEQFYLVFALVWVCLARSRRAPWVLAIVALLIALISSGLRVYLTVAGVETARIYYGSDTRMEGIALGVLAAVYYFRSPRGAIPMDRVRRALASDWALVAGGVVFVLTLLVRSPEFRDTLRYTLQALVACVVILYGLLPGDSVVRRTFYRFCSSRFVSLVGLASYSIYLVHLSLIYALEPYLAELPWFLRFGVSVVVGVGAGIAMYKVVEVPVHRWRTERDATRTRLRGVKVEQSVP
ncbi:acyltransferase family protein [Sanguibacter suaedae]|uniref:Acyltransferase n=1 Tax=Sanguibacter suaedae TaxID=2795737 RepID=A0A934MF17_9MICO|nr:acyltransferase [Sanguibacter suaedae]MBI9116204.1 acyltransferase [Sanguibacter suaedae]